MNANLKSLVDMVLNRWLLRRFGLRVSYAAGGDPLDDMVRLLAGRTVASVVDGGAYRGDFSLQAATLFPFATIYAVEPTASSFTLLSSRTAAISRIKPIQRALGSAPGRAVLHRNASPLTNSLSSSTREALRYFEAPNAPQGTEEVDVETLEALMLRESRPSVDVLKLDLQGHELQALLGLGSFLRSVQLVYSEVEFVRLYEGAPLFSEVDAYLRNNGFAFYQFYGLVRAPDDGRLLYGDALFANEDLLFGRSPGKC